MKITTFILTGLACFAFTTASANDSHGKVKICRIALPGADTGSVFLPGDGKYKAACDSADNCRKFVIGATAPNTLKAGVGSCTTFDAVLLQDDGQPVGIGQSLVAQWPTGKMEAAITVVQGFR